MKHFRNLKDYFITMFIFFILIIFIHSVIKFVENKDKNIIQNYEDENKRMEYLDSLN